MVEIRKHYPAETTPVRKQPTPPRDAIENTMRIVTTINQLVEETLTQGQPLAYYVLHAEIFMSMKLIALKVCNNNIAKGAKLLGMKRTTFRESIRKSNGGKRIR